MSDPNEVRPVISGMRWILRLASLLVLIAGYQLFILTEHTDLYFSWTIKPFLTAGFLGASYWASFLLVFQASREKAWSNARAGVFSALTFTSMTTVATMLHLDRFHFHSPETITLVANWAWMLVYWLVPPLLLYIFIKQIRLPGSDAAREFPMPLWLKLSLGLQGLIMLFVGGALFLRPSETLPHWPWSLSPLTAQAVGAWLLGMAVAAIAVLKENDLMRARGAIFCYAFLGLFQLIALARYATSTAPDTGASVLQWGDATTWLYPLFWLSVLLVGIFSIQAYFKRQSPVSSGSPP